MPHIDAILKALYSEPGWDTLALVLRVLFMVAMARILLLLLRPVSTVPVTQVVRPGVGFVVLVLVPFLGLLAHQATWHLTGFTRPAFMKFMQQYDRRQFNPARTINRGRILDRNGKILAFTYLNDQKQPRRQYPHHGAACHVTGYLDPTYGLTGIEAAANATLSGGRLENAEDWRELGKQWLAGEQEIKGDDVKVSLDIELQRAAWKAMAERPGAVMVLDVRTGQILVLLSTPTFDPEQIGAGLFQSDDPSARMLNRATQGLYPPGSTFKVLGAAVAAKAGFTAHLSCTGDGYTTHVQYPRIQDHDFYERSGSWHGHGSLGLNEALAESCNEFFSQLSVRMGLDKLVTTAESFGFGQAAELFTGPNGTIRITKGPGIRLRASDRYGLAQVGIGQGNLVCSPAHMLLVTAAIANQGRLLQPTLHAGKAPTIWTQALSPAHAGKVAAAMRRVVTDGTGRGLRDAAYPMAGKTGTAQNPHGASHAWFTGFAPYGAPRLAIVVLVENAGYGSVHAVPVVRAVFDKARELGYLGGE